VTVRSVVLVLVLMVGNARAELPPPGPLPELVETPPAAPPTAEQRCLAEATELRDHLTSQRGSANTWNAVWRWTFTGAAVATAVVGYIDPFPDADLQHGLYGSAGKATIGALARWILPLHIRVPAVNADACADVAQLRAGVKLVANKERGMFWLGHIGGLLVNLGGAAYVYYYDGLGKAALSVAIGYPVGVLSNYTMPRGSWKLYRAREAAWQVTTVGVLPLRSSEHNGWVLGVGGTW
jgi:hypothetical protein